MVVRKPRSRLRIMHVFEDFALLGGASKTSDSRTDRPPGELVLQLAEVKASMTPEGPEIPPTTPIGQLATMKAQRGATEPSPYSRGAVRAVKDRRIYVKDIEALEDTAR